VSFVFVPWFFLILGYGEQHPPFSKTSSCKNKRWTFQIIHDPMISWRNICIWLCFVPSFGAHSATFGVQTSSSLIPSIGPSCSLSHDIVWSIMNYQWQWMLGVPSSTFSRPRKFNLTSFFFRYVNSKGEVVSPITGGVVLCWYAFT